MPFTSFERLPVGSHFHTLEDDWIKTDKVYEGDGVKFNAVSVTYEQLDPDADSYEELDVYFFDCPRLVQYNPDKLLVEAFAILAR
ncbi:MAG: hypothetical protein ACI9H6_000462 [Patiriisocius sp.]|jgi:hypothetical protein